MLGGLAGAGISPAGACSTPDGVHTCAKEPMRSVVGLAGCEAAAAQAEQEDRLASGAALLGLRAVDVAVYAKYEDAADEGEEGEVMHDGALVSEVVLSTLPSAYESHGGSSCAAAGLGSWLDWPSLAA
jgi:hypothetical protein